MAPAQMSLTSTVPEEVPSHFHNSAPWLPSWARKKSVPLTFVGFTYRGSAMLLEPGLTSLRRVVPVEAPLEVHSSVPWLPSLAAKNSVPLTLAGRLELPPPSP